MYKSDNTIRVKYEVLGGTYRAFVQNKFGIYSHIYKIRIEKVPCHIQTKKYDLNCHRIHTRGLDCKINFNNYLALDLSLILPLEDPTPFETLSFVLKVLGVAPPISEFRWPLRD